MVLRRIALLVCALIAMAAAAVLIEWSAPTPSAALAQCSIGGNPAPRAPC